MVAVDSPIPNFFVVGAARCGTTALTQIIAGHPQGFVAQPKEPHFLAFRQISPNFSGPGDAASINAVSITDDQRYLDLYRGAHGKVAVGEGSVTSLYYYRPSLDTLHELFPEARVIILLRNPADRAFSAYMYMRTKGLEPCETFSDALADEERRINGGWQHIYHYKSGGYYADSVGAYVRELGIDRTLILDYEALATRPQAIADSLWAFLGIEPFALGEVHRVNSSGQPRSNASQWLLNRGRVHPHLGSAVKKIVPFSVRERMRARNLRPVELPDVARQELLSSYILDVERLVEAVPAEESWISRWFERSR